MKVKCIKKISIGNYKNTEMSFIQSISSPNKRNSVSKMGNLSKHLNVGKNQNSLQRNSLVVAYTEYSSIFACETPVFSYFFLVYDLLLNFLLHCRNSDAKQREFATSQRI